MFKPFAKVSEIGRSVDNGARVVSLDGLTSTAAKSFVLSEIETSKTIVVVTESNAALETWESDLQFWKRDSDASVLSLPSFTTDVYSGGSPHAETMERRALTTLVACTFYASRTDRFCSFAGDSNCFPRPDP
jgi:hypothetical protein